MVVTTKYLGGGIIEGRSDDQLISAVPQTSWKELAKVTTSSAGCSSTLLTSGTITAKDNLMLLVHTVGSGSITGHLRFNGSGADGNYARRNSNNGSDSGDGSDEQDQILAGWGSSGEETMVIANIRNVSGKEKVVFLDVIANGTDGATNQVNRREVTGKWANTSGQITSIQFIGEDGGTFTSDTQMVVLGCDDDEADSGTNFWQELVDVENDSAASVIDSGTFTSKRWLMGEFWIDASNTDGNTTWVVNSSTNDDNYSMRRSYDGENESTYTGSNGNPAMTNQGMYTGYGALKNETYFKFFIVNLAGKEKIFVWHGIFATDGNSASNRVEGCGKWSDTSNQIERIRIFEGGSNNYYAKSKMRIWGSD